MRLGVPPLVLVAALVLLTVPASADTITFAYDALDSVSLTKKTAMVSWEFSQSDMADLLGRGGGQGTYYLEMVYRGGVDQPYFDITLTMMPALYPTEIIYRQAFVLDDVPYSHYLSPWQPDGHWTVINQPWYIDSNSKLIMGGDPDIGKSIGGWWVENPVPEPSTLVLLALALVPIAASYRWWRN